MTTAHAAPARPSALDRFLRLFTEVRAGESVTALLLTANVFLLFTAYYVLRVVRQVLIARSGADVAAYSSAGQALLLLAAVPIYGALAAHLPRRRLINVVTYFFVACLAVFFLSARVQLPVGVPFYIWLGIFNVMLVAQFWSFANDVYTTDEGKRLFPIVGFGASSGAVFGSWIQNIIREYAGLYASMIVAAALLVLAVVITNLIDARERRRTESTVPSVKTSGILPAATLQVRTAAGALEAPTAEHSKASGVYPALKPNDDRRLADTESDVPRSTGGAFVLVWRNRYLFAIAFLVLLLNWVNTSGETILLQLVIEAADAAVAAGNVGSADEYVGGFYSKFFFGVNLTGLLLQLFIVSRVIKHLGVQVALLFLPVLAFAGYAMFAFLPILGIVRWTKTLENATDYSLNNTVRNVLFLPTTREEKYKAKQVTDSLAQRLGDVLNAATVFVGLNLLAFSTQQFAMVNLFLVIVWLVIAVFIGRRYRMLAAATS